MVQVRLRDKIPGVDKPSVAALLRKYLSFGSLQKDERVSWHAGPYHEYQLAVLGCLEFSEGAWPELKKWTIEQASSDCIKSGLVDPDAFVDAVGRSIKRYFASKPIDTTLLTKLACHAPPKNMRFKLPGATLTIHSRKPATIDVTPFAWAQRVAPSEPHHDAYVTVRTPRTTLRDRFEGGLRGLSPVEALLNLVLTYDQFTLISTHTGLPIRRISTGKNFIVFEDGVRYENAWRYVREEAIIASSDLVAADKFSAAAEKVRVLLLRLRKHPLFEELSSALVLYQNALEARDVDTALMRMWSAVEMLALTSEQPNKNETIKRVAGIFHANDEAFVAATLAAIVHCRNRGVHHGEHDAFGFALVEKCKNFFERMLLFYVRNKSGLRSKKDYIAFLSAPHDAMIDEQVKIWTKRKRFRNARPKKAA